MAVKTLFRTAALAAALLAAAACVYPYEVELSQSGEWPLVVEGNILLGSTTTVSLSHVRPLDADEFEFQSISATGYIEGEDGSRIEGLSYSSFITFDTRTLRDDQRYRLCFTTQMNGQESNSFESDWLAPCPAPTIDALTYSHHPEYEELWIGLSMHCNGSHYFRWYFDETWEYHSDINSHFLFDPETRTMGYYQGPNLYYCWSNASSHSIEIFSTANQTEDRFEELAFHTIPLDDKRLQVLYRITVKLEAITEDAYNYWYNIQQNTEGQGSIFSPTPSEMASNIRCTTDPSVQVLGYLYAATQSQAVMYYDNAVEDYYTPVKPYERFDQKVSADRPDSMAYWYSHGYLPYQDIYAGMSPKPTHYMWAQNLCIDCRRQGGSKSKPADWPNNDQ